MSSLIGDLVWLHLRKEMFHKKRKSKLHPHGDGHFQILRKVNNNAYQLGLLEEYGVHTAFNVTDLIPFVDGYEEDNNPPILRINHLQEGGDDDLGSTIGPVTSQPDITSLNNKIKIRK